jgi:uncharacterized membrane protein
MSTSAPRAMVPTMVGVLLVSFALHGVPQALREFIDPAWSMLALMILDVALIALLARSWGPLRVAVLIGIVLAVTIALRQQAFAALPSIVFNLLLAAGFGFTLRAGQVPLLERIAAARYPHEMTPAFVTHLRRLTRVWVVFFFAMAAVSLLLALTAPFVVWSFFVNVLTWPLVALVFLIEWAYRRRLRPELPPHTPLQIVASIFAYRGPMLPSASLRKPPAPETM